MNLHVPALDPELGSARGLRVLLAAWAVAAAVLLVQGAAEQVVDRGTVTLEFLLRWRLLPVALWAAASPAVLLAGRRWPVSSRRWPFDLIVHGGLFSAWMVASNVVLRLPDLITRTGVAAVGSESLAAAVEYAPPGALVWMGLVALARRAPRADGADLERREDDGDREDPLQLRVGYRTYLVSREAIRWVEADGDYLRVHTAERTHRIRGPMKAFRRELGDDRFLRIHRSTLVNVDFVREVQPYFHGDYVAILRDGTELRIPRSRRQAIERLRG